MNKIFLAVILGALAIFSGCAWFVPKTPMTQMQIREFQTRAFDVKDPKLVIKALLGVLQDDGYIVKNADADLGFLTATKETDLGNGGAIWTVGNKTERWRKTAVVETTANVSAFGKNQTRVRVNFQEKVLDNMGGVVEVSQVTNEKFYQDFFAKVDKGLFIQKEKL